MATANTLESALTCPVCFDIFDDPQILRECFHTLCLKCVKKLENGGQVRCPECRLPSHIAKISKDFKTQRIIDVCQPEQNYSSEVELVHLICGLCETSTALVTCHCSDCENFLCSKCVKLHEDIKLLESHNVAPVPSIVKDFESSLPESLDELENQVENIDKHLMKITAARIDVKSSRTKQIEDIRKFTQDEINSLRENEKRLEKIVSGLNKKLLNHLETTEEFCNEQKEYFQAKIVLLKDMMKGQDIRTLQETADSVNDTIKEDINKIKEKLQRIKTDLDGAVIVKKGRSMYVQDLIKVMTDDAKFDSLKTQRALQGVCYKLWTKTFQQCQKTKLEYLPRRLCMCNNQLYCLNPNPPMIQVYDKECQLITEIQRSEFKILCSLTALDPDYIIASAQNGVFKLDQLGQNCTKISDGWFADIDCYDGDLYVLDHNQCNVITLKGDFNTTDQWNRINRFKLKYSNGIYQDTITVSAGFIYVSSWHNNYILQYNTQGELLHQIGGDGGSPCVLKHSYLCGGDQTNDVLFADSGNHRLQVLDNKGQCHQIQLADQVDWPQDAVVSQDGEMWIIKHGTPRALLKFTLV